MNYTEPDTPSYIVQEGKIRKNLEILNRVSSESGCKILLAQKAFSMFRLYPLIAEYLSGATASGFYEAKLWYEEVIDKGIASENHVFEPAFKDKEMKEVCEIADHIVFNSINQLEHHRSVWEKYAETGRLSVGLRVNPEHSTQEGHEIYDPAAKGSRLGIRLCNFPEKLPEGVEGLHFHTLCEQGLEPLIETFEAFEKSFGGYLDKLKWINLGGGHHITREDYDVEGLISFIKGLKEKYKLDIYLEPGEAVALNAGTLITTVMDVVDTDDYPTAILDASAACHMPDVLEMPYLPPLLDSVEEGTGVKVRLASRTCLAGDVIGIYELKEVPKPGDVLTFGDMAIYSMVKNNTFNGMRLPDIVLERESGEYELVRSFGYEDFKNRLS